MDAPLAAATARIARPLDDSALDAIAARA